MSRKVNQQSKKKRKLKERRVFSEAFRQARVKEIDKGLMRVCDMVDLYGVSKQTVYNWLHKYSKEYQKGVVKVVQMESEGHKTRLLLSRVKELEAALGRKQLELEYLERLISLASEELQVDLKKNFATPPSTVTIDPIKKKATK